MRDINLIQINLNQVFLLKFKHKISIVRGEIEYIKLC